MDVLATMDGKEAQFSICLTTLWRLISPTSACQRSQVMLFDIKHDRSGIVKWVFFAQLCSTFSVICFFSLCTTKNYPLQHIFGHFFSFSCLLDEGKIKAKQQLSALKSPWKQLCLTNSYPPPPPPPRQQLLLLPARTHPNWRMKILSVTGSLLLGIQWYQWHMNDSKDEIPRH